MKLGLGTVQFGQAYGVSNTRGQVPDAEVGAILARAAQAGVMVLDTAANYGDAETVLARQNLAPFRTVTKTISARNGIEAVVARARQSAASLKANTLLVHATGDLENADLWPALQRLKTEGLFGKVGISVYAADDPASLAEQFKPDTMQLPFSLLDQRLLRDGTLTKLKKFGVEIHARSLFLQGLLFLERMPEKLRHVEAPLTAIRAKIRHMQSTPLAAALGFVLARPEVDVALVGVTQLSELNEILAASTQPLPELDWPALALDDEIALTPSRW